MIDFTNEQEQKERNYGPVPSGSIVVVKLELQAAPESMQGEKPFIFNARSGLLMLNLTCTVKDGDYAGVRWYQRITLPCACQKIALDPKQETACSIGGSMLKAILQAAKRPLQITSYDIFNGLVIPVKVKISNNPYVANGNTYWKNEIAKIITPSMPEYQEVRQSRELINYDGAVTGTARTTQARQPQTNSGFDFGNVNIPDNINEVDEVPFS